MAWYRTGTVTVIKGSKQVTGVDTLWKLYVTGGDLLSLDGDTFYEIASVESNTSLTLAEAYIDESEAAVSYMTIPLSTQWSMTSTLAQRLSDHITNFNKKIDAISTTPTANVCPMADSTGSLKLWTDSLRQASTSQLGVVKLADKATALAGTDSTTAVTPASLNLGQPGGVALLDSDGHVSLAAASSAQLNAVDITELTDIANFDSLTHGAMLVSKGNAGIVSGTATRYFIVQVFKDTPSATSPRCQLAMGNDASDIWTRQYTDEWGDWKRVVFDGECLKLEGGELSGDLTTHSVMPDSASSRNLGTTALPFKDVHTDTLTASSVEQKGTSSRLGTEAYPWKDLYVTNVHAANIDGTNLTVTGKAATAAQADNATSAQNAATADIANGLAQQSEIGQDCTVINNLDFKQDTTLAGKGEIVKRHDSTSDTGTELMDFGPDTANSNALQQSGLRVSAVRHKAYFLDGTATEHELALAENQTTIPDEAKWKAFNTDAGVKKVSLPDVDGAVYAVVAYAVSSTAGFLTTRTFILRAGEDDLDVSLSDVDKVDHISGFYWRIQ